MSDLEQLKPIAKPLQTETEQRERRLAYQAYIQTRKAKFADLKTQGKETYFIGGDSMKCLVCKKTITSSISIKARYCITCDIFHDFEDDPQTIFKKSL